MTKFQNILAVCAVALAFAGHQATAQNSVRLFKDELEKKVGNKKGVAAAKAAGRTIKRFLRRDAEKAVAFVRIGNAAVTDVSRKNQLGRTADIILLNASRGFLGSDLLTDRRFSRFVRLVVRRLPGNQKTDAVLGKISDTLIRVNLSRGGRATQDQFLRNLVYGAGGQIPPMS